MMLFSKEVSAFHADWIISAAHEDPSAGNLEEYFSNDDVKSSAEILTATLLWKDGDFEGAIDILLNGVWYIRKQALINILVAEALEEGLFSKLESVVRKHIMFTGKKPVYYKLLDDHLKVVAELLYDR